MRVIILPAFLLLIALGSGLMSQILAGLESYRGGRSMGRWERDSGIALGIFYCSTWLATWYGTVAIALRLYSVGMATVNLRGDEDGRRRHPYRKIIFTMIESGLILSMFVFVISVFYVMALVHRGYTVITVRGPR